MGSELNKKLREVIEYNIEYDNDDAELDTEVNVWGYDNAANECEKICLQSQIDLLNVIEYPNGEMLGEKIKQFKNQLKTQLNNLK